MAVLRICHVMSMSIVRYILFVDVAVGDIEVSSDLIIVVCSDD
jgi:hypothetical protein